MIEGVECKPLQVHLDDRGSFMEILRDDDPFFTRFGQSSFTMTYPGVVKAWHYHAIQDDLWFVASGMAQIGLHDLRDDSPTRGRTQVFYLGEHNRALLFIPHGVAHGYRVLGGQPMTLVYYTTHVYNPRDELRRPWNDPEIGLSWTTENR
ncbi:MAG: dTDP-4-dehydrorhamnose 3,5-epimerase family protein [Chloroflexi bacterium]|nr:dTDP-4-dehydrorhamnose 3,5-epimerase family protein [Chloroflexota bacterium]MBV9543795.1 dTDP-4-dehydrorhamnose 3,5-epimerase family protein [Chloroflexota bacterium]